VGTVTLSGLTQPVRIAGVNNTYFAPLPAMPFDLDADIRLDAQGGRYGSFSLAGRGIERLAFASTGLEVVRGRPLALRWVLPSHAAPTRILASLDIAHHGGIAARLECDLADTGSATLPASLITRLIEKGTAGFPTISLSRRTVDSTALASGCVEFSVVSSVEANVQVEGVVSCRDDLPCPAERTCGPDLKCH
jgi:hypothetical protein